MRCLLVCATAFGLIVGVSSPALAVDGEDVPAWKKPVGKPSQDELQKTADKFDTSIEQVKRMHYYNNVVLPKRREARRKRQAKAAEKRAAEIADMGSLNVSQINHWRVEAPHLDEPEINPSFVIDKNGTPVVKLRPDQDHDHFVAFNPWAGGVNLAETVSFRKLDEPAADPTKVSSWLKPNVEEVPDAAWQKVEQVSETPDAD